jgi:hypothetical protein
MMEMDGLLLLSSAMAGNVGLMVNVGDLLRVIARLELAWSALE